MTHRVIDDILQKFDKQYISRVIFIHVIIYNMTLLPNPKINTWMTNMIPAKWVLIRDRMLQSEDFCSIS